MRLPIQYNLLTADDYPKLLKLWIAAGSIEVRPVETANSLALFLQKNPTSNYSAYVGSRLIGAVLLDMMAGAATYTTWRLNRIIESVALAQSWSM